MTSSKIFLATAALALAAGCVSTPVSAPSDGQILLSANPSAITLDEFGSPPVTAASSVVTAQVFDANGTPQPNVELFFSSDAGTLASTAALKTDDNGRATNTLTAQLGDPTTIRVTVRSGTVSATLELAKTEIPANQAPFPVIDISPANSATFGDTVIMDGSFSDDPDGDPITCFQWEIQTGQNIAAELPCTPPNSRCEIAQGPRRTNVIRVYNGVDITDEQQILVILRVSDDPSISCPTNSVTPASAFNGITFESYDIICDATPPTAAAGPNLTVSVGGGTQVTVAFSGAASSDPDSGIASYEWNCGNGTPLQSGVTASCTYTNAGTTNVQFIASLTVTNGCGTTNVDTVTVTVTP